MAPKSRYMKWSARTYTVYFKIKVLKLTKYEHNLSEVCSNITSGATDPTEEFRKVLHTFCETNMSYKFKPTIREFH